MACSVRADDHRWIVVMLCGLLLVWATLYLVFDSSADAPLAVGFALWAVSVAIGWFVPILKAKDREAAYRAAIGDPPPPTPSRRVTWRTVVLIFVLGGALVALAWRSPDALDRGLAWVMLLYLPAMAVITVRLGLAMRIVEMRVRREAATGLLGDADLPGRAPGIRDAWDAASVSARRWSMAIGFTGAAVWAGGSLWVLGVTRSFEPGEVSDTLFVALGLLWWAANLAALAPLAVWTYWHFRWIRVDAALRGSMDSQAVMDYLNRAQRPRLDVQGWVAKLRREMPASWLLLSCQALVALFVCAALLWSVWLTVSSRDLVSAIAVLPLVVVGAGCFLFTTVALAAGTYRQRRVLQDLERRTGPGVVGGEAAADGA